MRRVVLAIVAVIAFTFVPSRSALAACHQFRITTSPTSVVEGGVVTITITRDGNIGASHVDVATVDESAVGGSDYAAIRQTVNFTSETSRTLQLQTTNDNAAESAETLRLHMSNPGGCTVNPNFDVGPDASVTITDNDVAAPASTAGGAGTTSRPATTRGATTTTAAGPTTEVTLPAEETSTSADNPVVIDEERDDDDDGGAGPLLAGLGILAVLGAGGFAFYRFRAARS